MYKRIVFCIILILLSLCVFAEYADSIADSDKYIKDPAPFINTWAVLGVFNEKEAIDTDIIGEASVEPYVGQETGGKTWEYFDDRLFSRNYDDYVDLYSYYKVKKKDNVDGCVIYLHNYVFSPKEQQVQIRWGGDRYSKVFLNGEEIGKALVGFPNNVITYTDPDWWHAGGNWKHLQDNATKDANKVNVTLKKGWNRVLVKVGNDREGVLGLYFRISGNKGENLNLITSPNGPKSSLTIDNNALILDGNKNMPIAYRGWPYVGFDLGETFYNYIKSVHFPAHYTSTVSASDFVFTAGGGSAPYSYSLTGKLPKGLSFKNGKIMGKVALHCEIKDYPITLTVKDAQGQTATKDFVITVKERPNKWVEEGRMTALIHSPETIPADKIEEAAQVVKDQGYCLVMPINFNNGLYNFRSQNRFNTVPEKDLGDALTPLVEPFESRGVKVGTYVGNVIPAPQFAYDQVVAMYEDMITRYMPKAIWHDWLGVCHGSTDAIFSLVKTINPDIVIFENGIQRFTNGDWDVLAIEFMSNTKDKEGDIWSSFVYDYGKNLYPSVYNWPKAYSMETWHSLASPDLIEKFPDKVDWDSFLKLNIAVICEGGISNLDHTIGTAEEEFQRFEQHKKMAAWCNGETVSEPLYHAYTNCYPVYEMVEDWGYVNVSLDGKNLYAIAMKNPRGKIGLTGKDIMINSFRGDVDSVINMNSGESVKFLQKGKVLTLSVKDVKPDQVANIFKIILKEPISYDDTPRTLKPEKYTNKKNLAYQKVGYMQEVNGNLWTLSSGFDRYASYGTDGFMDTDVAAGERYNWGYMVDLDNEYSIGKVKVYMTGVTTKYRLEVSLDSKNWDVIEKGENPDLNKELEFSFPKIKARYVRFVSLKPDGPGQPGGQMGLREIEVY